jgi:hypothetical protein
MATLEKQLEDSRVAKKRPRASEAGERQEGGDDEDETEEGKKDEETSSSSNATVTPAKPFDDANAAQAAEIAFINLLKEEILHLQKNKKDIHASFVNMIRPPGTVDDNPAAGAAAGGGGGGAEQLPIAEDLHVSGLREMLEAARTRDNAAAPTVLSTLMNLLTNAKLHRCGDGSEHNTVVWERLKNMENVPASDYKGYRKKDPGNLKVAETMRLLQQCCHLIVHIIINIRSKGQSPTEWIYAISVLLKQGRLIGSVINILNKMHLTLTHS